MALKMIIPSFLIGQFSSFVWNRYAQWLHVGLKWGRNPNALGCRRNTPVPFPSSLFWWGVLCSILVSLSFWLSSQCVAAAALNGEITAAPQGKVSRQKWKVHISFRKTAHLFVCLFVLCMREEHVPWHTCRSQRKTCESWFLPLQHVFRGQIGLLGSVTFDL